MLLIGALVVPFTLSAAVEVFVAPTGRDSNPGSQAAPFASLEKARDALRFMRKEKGLSEGGATVWLRGGDYPRTNRFELTAEDAGSTEAPTTYRAWSSESVRLLGGQPLAAAWFSAVPRTSPVWDRLAPEAQGHVMQVDLAAHGITDFGVLRPRGYGLPDVPAALELFFDRTPMPLARWPDPGESDAHGSPGPTKLPLASSGATGTVSFTDSARIENGFAKVLAVRSETSFTYADDRPARWGRAKEVWFHGYWKYLWADDCRRALRIDPATRTVDLEGPLSYGLLPGRPFCALNLLEEITRPGEWVLDRSSGTLYFWPPAPLTGHEIEVSVLQEPLIVLNGTRHVTLQGLTLDMSRTELIRITGGEDNTVNGCALRNAGTYAARVTGLRNGLAGCEISDPGDGGVTLAGGDRLTLTSSGLFVRDCDIRRFSRWSWTYTPGVLLGGGSVGHTVAHNRIHDAPHSAVMMDWGNNHTIEFNEIFNVCSVTADAGAIYCGRDLASRGNVIRYNFIHDIGSPLGDCGVHGIYLDDGISGIRVEGNVLYRILDNAIQAGGGRDNVIVNNLMVKCGTGLAADARGIGWMMADSGSSNLWKDLQSLPYRGPVWSNAYPACAAIPADWATFSNAVWMVPRGSVFARNVGFHNRQWTTEVDHAFSYYAQITNNLPDVNPRFVDEAHLDLTLKSNSPALTLPGFVPIPFRQIGPR